MRGVQDRLTTIVGTREQEQVRERVGDEDLALTILAGHEQAELVRCPFALVVDCERRVNDMFLPVEQLNAESLTELDDRWTVSADRARTLIDPRQCEGR